MSRAAALKTRLSNAGLSYAQLGAQVGISKQQVADVLNHGKWPKAPARARLREMIDQALAAKAKPAEEVSPSAGSSRKPESVQPGAAMLLRKQPLTPAARKAFTLFTNPFDGDVSSDEEMFLTPDIRYVREALLHAAKNAGFVAIIGESGAGKSTVKDDLIERIAREKKDICVIQPSVLGMEDNDRRGKTLKSTSLADAVIWSVNPLAKPPGSMEAKTRTMQRLLEDSAQAGNAHVLVIEEAHRLACATLKHLKGFHELRSGRKRLLGVVLLGQQELLVKLSETNHELREVVQRCEIATLEPLDRHLRDYIAFRCRRVELDMTQMIDEPAIEALRARLSVGRPGEKGFRSLLYPLAVNNLMTFALNEAADLGAPRVTADIVRGL